MLVNFLLFLLYVLKFTDDRLKFLFNLHKNQVEIQNENNQYRIVIKQFKENLRILH